MALNSEQPDNGEVQIQTETYILAPPHYLQAKERAFGSGWFTVISALSVFCIEFILRNNSAGANDLVTVFVCIQIQIWHISGCILLCFWTSSK